MVGISGTPTYVINGQVLAGAQGYDAILDLVEKARN
jgi:protein-disulfide isomerase